MSTTTNRLPGQLNVRIAAAAKREDFNDVAEKRFGHIIGSGKTIPWNEMRSYLEGPLAGKSVKRPVAQKLIR